VSAGARTVQRPTSRRPQRPRRRWRIAPRWLPVLLAVLLFVGIIPVALGGELFGAWRLPGPTLPNILATPTPPPSFAPPRDLWTAATVDVLPHPAAGAPQARLEPGFPVHLNAWRWVGAAGWAHITWAGPTHSTGGAGWVAATSLTGFAPHTHSIGDLGALAPGLGAAAESGHIAAALYFPSSGQLYLSTTADQPIALGGGVRAVLLAALFATAAAHHQPPPVSGSGSTAALLASGDAATMQQAYTKLGDATGLATYVHGLSVDGFQFVPGQPLATTASPHALLAFSVALLSGGALSSADRQTVVGLLAQAQASSGALLAPASVIGAQGVLITATVTASAGATGGATASACGLLAPTGGPQAFVATASGANTTDVASGALSTWYGQLAGVLASST
jgi:hypothetical protein